MNLTLLCALLAVENITLTEGNATLSEEQLKKIEARLKELDDAKTAAENSLSAAGTAMDELDPTVKGAKDLTGKIEAVRTKLSQKPGVQTAGGALDTDKNADGNIEGKDEVNGYIKGII